MFGKKKKKGAAPEINASSMADIAFLLLVFFLVTTTIATDKGVTLVLPPYEEVKTQVDIADRNVLVVLINYKNELLVEDEPFDIAKMKETVVEFLEKSGKGDEKFPENTEKAIVSVKADRGTSYAVYLEVIDQIKAGYHEVRAKELGISVADYLQLDPDKNRQHKIMLEKAQAAFPMNLSIAEPTKVGQ